MTSGVRSNLGNRHCILCDMPTDDFACSHIIPKSFFNLLPKMAGVPRQNRYAGRVLSSSGEDRKYTNALYIDHEICQKCEHEFLADYDNYAAKIYLDRMGAKNVPSGESDCRLIAIPGRVDRRKLRAFWASLIWRFSVARTFAFSDFRIDPVWGDKIRDDMVAGREFAYVDAMCLALTDPAMSNFDDPKIVNRGNGFLVSVRLPLFYAVVFVNCGDGVFSNGVLRIDGMDYGSSLRQDFPGDGYVFGEMSALPGEFERLSVEHFLAKYGCGDR